MDFIKKHYEKLILLLLLVVFIASMFHVLNIIRQTGEIKDSDLQIPTRDPDYKIHAADDPKFDVSALMKNTALRWDKLVAREKENEDHYSDLVQVFAISRCPFCNKLIPRTYMEQKQVCPFCKNVDREKKNNGKAFVAPPPRISVKIPPEILQELKLDPNDLDAPYYDIDNDGFSNVYEYMRKTKMDDPQSHPPLWHRLRVVDVGKVPLPIEFMALNTLDSADPKMWEFQIKNGSFSDLYMIGSELEIERKYFRITKVEKREEDAPDGKGKRDASVLYLKETEGDQELTMKIGTPLKSLADRAILEDLASPGKQMILEVGRTITLGNQLTGIERYRIKSLDATGKTVLLENPAITEGDATKDKSGAVMRITTLGQIPYQMRVRAQKVQEGYDPGMFGPRGNMPQQQRRNVPQQRR